MIIISIIDSCLSMGSVAAVMRCGRVSQIIGLAAFLWMTGLVHANEATGVRCERVHRHDLTERVVTYTTPEGKTYALNGYARIRARSRGWLNGSKELPPEQVAVLLRIGLELCKHDTQ